MISVLLAFVIIVGSTIGTCSAIGLIGYFATKGVRYQHEEVMFDKHEQAKLNAIEVEAKKLGLVETQMRQIERGATNPYIDVNDRGTRR